MAKDPRRDWTRRTRWRWRCRASTLRRHRHGSNSWSTVSCPRLSGNDAPRSAAIGLTSTEDTTKCATVPRGTHGDVRVLRGCYDRVIRGPVEDRSSRGVGQRWHKPSGVDVRHKLPRMKLGALTSSFTMSAGSFPRSRFRNAQIVGGRSEVHDVRCHTVQDLFVAESAEAQRVIPILRYCAAAPRISRGPYRGSSKITRAF